jgi:hypothetical protein
MSFELRRVVEREEHHERRCGRRQMVQQLEARLLAQDREFPFSWISFSSFRMDHWTPTVRFFLKLKP